MNPILPSQYYIPDVEARKDEDGNIYLYGSKDCCGNDEYCSYEYQVFSSSDMKNFQAHPVSFISYDEASHMAAHGKNAFICAGLSENQGQILSVLLLVGWIGRRGFFGKSNRPLSRMRFL